MASDWSPDMVVRTLSSGRQNKQKGKARIKIQKTKNKIRKNKQQQGDTSASGSNFLFHSERVTRFRENEKEISSKTCEKRCSHINNRQQKQK